MLKVLQKKAKGVFERLKGPATADDLEELGALGAPSGLVALLSKHDGSDGGFIRDEDLCSIEQIRKLRSMMNGILAKQPKEFATYWQPEWIPFVNPGDGQLWCIDPNATLVPGNKGQIQVRPDGRPRPGSPRGGRHQRWPGPGAVCRRRAPPIHPRARLPKGA